MLRIFQSQNRSLRSSKAKIQNTLISAPTPQKYRNRDEDVRLSLLERLLRIKNETKFKYRLNKLSYIKSPTKHWSKSKCTAGLLPLPLKGNNTMTLTLSSA